MEKPAHWPNGLSAAHFDGGLYLIREKQSSVPIGFTGFQVRLEKQAGRRCRTGYYSIGILPEYRNDGYAKEAVAKLLSMKSASVDQMRAMIVSDNSPSIRLAQSLGVPAIIKQAFWLGPSLGF